MRVFQAFYFACSFMFVLLFVTLLVEQSSEGWLALNILMAGASLFAGLIQPSCD